jgi:hypothetical protein
VLPVVVKPLSSSTPSTPKFGDDGPAQRRGGCFSTSADPPAGATFRLGLQGERRWRRKKGLWEDIQRKRDQDIDVSHVQRGCDCAKC